MGCVFNTMSVGGTVTEDDLRARFEDEQEQDRYENGHSYSGGFGMATGVVITTRTFADENAAYDWLNENAEKWGPALAVRYIAGGGQMRWMIGANCSS